MQVKNMSVVEQVDKPVEQDIIIGDVVSINRDRMGGTPVFKGTRVPIQTFIDHVEAGISVEEFLEDFPTVSKAQTQALVKLITSPIYSKVPLR